MQWIKGISPISFPGLGFTINPPAGFTIGTFSINFYGVIIALGLILAVLYGWKRSKEFGIKQDDITDGVLYIVPFAIICARLYYCAFKWVEEGYGANPISILYIWNGGLAIYGGVIGAAIGVTVYCLIKKIKLPALLDLVALGFLIGQSLGRWGNFFNREAFGAETNFFLRMGLMLTPDRDRIDIMHYYHPTFFYESLWNIGGFVLLHFLSKRRKYDGQIALGYAAWYGLGRSIIEGLRTDSLYWGPFRVSQLLAAVTCAAAAVVLVVMAFRYHDPKKLYVNQVAEAAVTAEESPEETAEETTEEPAEEAAEKTTEES
ncbi:MAG: prolipoprotein diacylglyceryl transferase [Ruminococcaceae bacterium]|nr:prolipoprotein diacylglyceryl transferase [Oscillospiraceae bacterium]